MRWTKEQIQLFVEMYAAFKQMPVRMKVNGCKQEDRNHADCCPAHEALVDLEKIFTYHAHQIDECTARLHSHWEYGITKVLTVAWFNRLAEVTGVSIPPILQDN